MASIGGNTFDGIAFGVETNGGEGIPDFDTELAFAKRQPPYSSGVVNTQTSGRILLNTLSYAIVVSEDDWANFLAKVGNVARPYLIAGRASRTARLVKVAGKRQLHNAGVWRATATWEG